MNALVAAVKAFIGGRRQILVLRPTARAPRLGMALIALLGTLACVHPVEALSPRRLLDVVDIGQPVVSPDGEWVAYRTEQASIERNAYDTIWYVQSLAGEVPPSRIADGGIPLRDSAGVALPSPAVWSPDGRWIYYRALMDEGIEVWRAATDGSGAEPVTSDSADIRRFVLSADGNVLKYSVGATREDVLAAEQAEYDRGIRIDDSVPLGQGLFRSGNLAGRLATQRYGDVWFDRAPLLAHMPEQWRAIELDSRVRSDISDADLPAMPLATADLAAERDPPWRLAQEPKTGRVALLTRIGDARGRRDKPYVRLAMLPDTRARRTVDCQAELCTGKAITGIQWRPESDEVLFTVTDPVQGLAQSIFRWNVMEGWVRPVTYARGLLSGDRDRSSLCAASAAALVCVVAEADGPPRLERIDVETGRHQRLFEPNAALAADMRQTQARLLQWSDPSGQQFSGQFYPARRANDRRPPLFVTYYRCAGFLRGGGVGDQWPLASLAERGVAALCINAAPYHLDAVERYDAGLSAVASAVDLLDSSGEIDRARVGMGGLSFGTEATLWTVINSDLLSAASITSPAISHQYYLLGSMRGEKFLAGLRKNWQAGAPDETPDRWQRLSPALNLEKIRVPILMQMPEQEHIHALDYAIPLVRDHRADFYVFPNEPHQLFQPKHRLAALERNLDWFSFWLLGYEDPEAAKAEQYAYWRLMKSRMSTRP